MDFFMNKKIFISFIIPSMYYLYNCKSNNIKNGIVPRLFFIDNI